MGFTGLLPSLGVEFDTFKNMNDPLSDHIAVVRDGKLNNDIIDGPFSFPGDSQIENGAFHAVEFEWVSSTMTFNVYWEGNSTPLISTIVDMAGIVGSDFAWLGFTASTGQKTNLQQVCVQSVRGSLYETVTPSADPSHSPSMLPSSSFPPTHMPSLQPSSSVPTPGSTDGPTPRPSLTLRPTRAPTIMPIPRPTQTPHPARAPTAMPTPRPTQTSRPTRAPTTTKTSRPKRARPTAWPTAAAPTAWPTATAPTPWPTAAAPTPWPTATPPTIAPYCYPLLTANPSLGPTESIYPTSTPASSKSPSRSRIERPRKRPRKRAGKQPTAAPVWVSGKSTRYLKAKLQDDSAVAAPTTITTISSARAADRFTLFGLILFGAFAMFF
jgi:hypothetical protein